MAQLTEVGLFRLDGAERRRAAEVPFGSAPVRGGNPPRLTTMGPDHFIPRHRKTRLPMQLAPRVSVVIPAFNAMRYLPDTLESAVNQDYDDYEIVIVDDGSTDNIAQWVNAAAYERVRIVSQPNGGLANARNRGIKESRGDLIAFLDADDLWRPTKLSRQVELMDQRPRVGVVYCGVEIIDGEGRSRGRVIINQESGTVWRSLLVHNIVECGSTPMVRRTCFERVGLFDESLGSHVEDRDMWLRIASYYEFAAVTEPLVCYRHHSASASSNWRAMEESTRKVNEKALAANPYGLDAAGLGLLRRRSYASAYIRLAWKALQGAEPDLQRSRALAKQARGYDRSLMLRAEHSKLMLAHALLFMVGPARFRTFLEGRDRIRAAARPPLGLASSK